MVKYLIIIINRLPISERRASWVYWYFNDFSVSILPSFLSNGMRERGKRFRWGLDFFTFCQIAGVYMFVTLFFMYLENPIKKCKKEIFRSAYSWQDVINDVIFFYF